MFILAPSRILSSTLWGEYLVPDFPTEAFRLCARGPWKGVWPINTEYAGWAVTARIPVKFGTAHGRSRPEVGSTNRIGANGKKGVPPAP